MNTPIEPILDAVLTHSSFLIGKFASVGIYAEHLKNRNFTHIIEHQFLSYLLHDTALGTVDERLHALGCACNIAGQTLDSFARQLKADTITDERMKTFKNPKSLGEYIVKLANDTVKRRKALEAHVVRAHKAGL